MLYFWPWKSDSASPSSFEKTLSTLSTKIANTQAHLDRFRSQSRRIRVLWSLYLGFVYLVYAIVLLLVVGYKNLGAYEWAGVAGGPILIYGIRAAITTFSSYRINTISARLRAQEQERAKTIQKLKDATKYDSTLELIEKYGGGPRSPPSKATDDAGPDFSTKSTNKPGPRPSARTNIPPPPTANIPRREIPQQVQDAPVHSTSLEPGAEFAPNAFSHPPPAPRSQQQYVTPETHWYDRIFDVLLGDDETAARNRFALICQSCRLVNGQAPPGTKSLAEVGIWRCSGCTAPNGEVDEGKRIMDEVLASVDDQPTDRGGEVQHRDVGADIASATTTATEGLSEAVMSRRRGPEK